LVNNRCRSSVYVVVCFCGLMFLILNGSYRVRFYLMWQLSLVLSGDHVKPRQSIPNASESWNTWKKFTYKLSNSEISKREL